MSIDIGSDNPKREEVDVLRDGRLDRLAAAAPKREGENPHSHNVSGYRTMSDDEVAAINGLNQLEREVAQRLETAMDLASGGPDGRCLALAKTHLEAGFMYAVKAIAKPADPYRGG